MISKKITELELKFIYANSNEERKSILLELNEARNIKPKGSYLS